MADTSKIKDTPGGWKWTGVTLDHQLHSEALQTARAAEQATYDAAQGNGGTARNGAALAALEAKVAPRANHQAGVHDTGA